MFTQHDLYMLNEHDLYLFNNNISTVIEYKMRHHQTGVVEKVNSNDEHEVVQASLDFVFSFKSSKTSQITV